MGRGWGTSSLQLDPDFSNSNIGLGTSFNGACVTYAQVARAPMFHRQRIASRKTLVILDEVHHGGDNLSWGDAIRVAFSVAKHRLSLTGTPFRSDTSAIPFVTYEPDGDGIYRSKADYTYGYAEALRDFVVRPVMFMSYTGNMQWQTKHGEVMEATLGEPLTKDLTAQAWRTALDPSGEWIQAVLKAADERLNVVRRSVPDAGGLVIATDHKTAKAYAGLLDKITGQKQPLCSLMTTLPLIRSLNFLPIPAGGWWRYVWFPKVLMYHAFALECMLRQLLRRSFCSGYRSFCPFA